MTTSSEDAVQHLRFRNFICHMLRGCSVKWESVIAFQRWRTYIHICECVYVYIYIHTYIDVYILDSNLYESNVWIFIYIYKRSKPFIHEDIELYTLTHAYIYIYTHIYKAWLYKDKLYIELLNKHAIPQGVLPPTIHFRRLIITWQLRCRMWLSWKHVVFQGRTMTIATQYDAPRCDDSRRERTWVSGCCAVWRSCRASQGGQSHSNSWGKAGKILRWSPLVQVFTLEHFTKLNSLFFCILGHGAFFYTAAVFRGRTVQRLNDAEVGSDQVQILCYWTYIHFSGVLHWSIAFPDHYLLLHSNLCRQISVLSTVLFALKKKPGCYFPIMFTYKCCCLQ